MRVTTKSAVTSNAGLDTCSTLYFAEKNLVSLL